jgi:hypothetical protein
MITTTRRRGPVGTWFAAALLGLLAVLGAGPAIAPVAVAAPGWVEVTDAPSGVTAALPATTDPVEVPYGRAYTPAGGEVAFAVLDVPVPSFVGLSTIVENVGPGLGVTVTESRETTVDGRDALDAVVDVERDGVRGTAFVRAVVDDGYVVVLATRATDADDTDARRLHERLVAGLRFG